MSKANTSTSNAAISVALKSKMMRVFGRLPPSSRRVYARTSEVWFSFSTDQSFDLRAVAFDNVELCVHDGTLAKTR